jgi:HEAT repeat protein
MRAIVWKISTFTAIGVAAVLAFRPLGPRDEKGGPAAEKPAHGSGGIFSWITGGGSSSHSTAPHTGTHLQQLRDSRNPTETCEALRVLAPEATGDEEAASEIETHTDASQPRAVRTCAISALEKVRSAGARTYLGELVGDPDTYVRDAALAALATKAKDDPEARSMAIAAAHSEDRETRLEALIALGDAHVPEASALIQDAIKHETGDTQNRLIAALGETHDAAAVGSITKMLDDGSTQTRMAALEALGSIGGDAAVNALKDKLATGSREDVAVAARALARTGDGAAKQALIDALKGDRRDAQLAALRALTQVEGEDVRAAMVQSLHSSDPQIVATASGWFSSHADRASVGELATLLKTAPPASRVTLVSALSSIGGDDARDAIATVARASGPERIQALNSLANMPGGRDEARKIALRVVKEGGQDASSALGVLGQDGSPEARDALVSMARAGGNVAPQAIMALAEHGDPDAMRALGDLTRSAKTPELRGRAVSALASTGNPQNATLLLNATHDKDGAVRHAALFGLARLGGDRAERAIADATTATDAPTRNTAIRALGTLHTPSAAATLEKLATSDGPTARAAFQSLASAAPDRAATIADRLLKSDDAETRQAVLQSAAQLPGDAARRISVSALRDADASVVSNAISNLENIGGPEAQQALLDLLSSEAPQATKRAAADALAGSGSDMAQQHQALIDRFKSASTDDENPADIVEGEREEDLD